MPYLKGGEDAAYELVMVLEDLNPQLFNTLGSAVAALHRATHDEHVAQAALSGRRYIEQLADVIFPARDELYNGRTVSKERYRSRIWAYIADNVGNDRTRSNVLGKELERIDEQFNAGIHGSSEKVRVLRALADVGMLTAALLALNPESCRQPYYAHARRIREFFVDALKSRSDKRSDGEAQR